MSLFMSHFIPYPPSRLDKERENSAALSVLPDLLRELDALPGPGARLLTLIEGRCGSQGVNTWDRCGFHGGIWDKPPNIRVPERGS